MGREWVEIRNWPGHEFEGPNMLEIVYYLYNSGEPAEFIAANMELEGEEEAENRVETGVRYFLSLPAGSKDVVMEQLEGQKYDVREGPGCKPPSPADYGVEAELGARRHYGVPFLEGITRSYRRDSFDDHPNIPGSLVSALSSGGMIRMTFSRSDRARRGAHKHAGALAERARRSENGGYTPGQELFKGKSHDGTERGSQGERTVRDQELEERAERWKDRADSGMFACDARVYGASPGQVERLAAVFPFRPNSFKINRMETDDGKKEEPEPDPEVPIPHKFRKYAPLTPVAVSFLALVWLFEGFRGALGAVAEIAGGLPGSLLTPQAVLLLSGLTGTLVWFAKDAFERDHIAFSIPELSLIVSIPEKLARFGEKGQEPADRTLSFPFEEQLTGEVAPGKPPEGPPSELEKEGEELPEEERAEPEEEGKRTEEVQKEPPSREEGETQEKAQKEQKTRTMEAPTGEPVRITGTLSEPATGEKLSNVTYEVLMDGNPYYSGETGEDASYALTFTPPNPGVYTLSVNLKGHPEVGEEIKIDSKPSTAGGTESKAESEAERDPPAGEERSSEPARREPPREEEAQGETQKDPFESSPPAEKYEVDKEKGGES